MVNWFRKFIDRMLIEVTKGGKSFEEIGLIHRWCSGGEILKFDEGEETFLKCSKCGETLGVILPEQKAEFVKTSIDGKPRKILIENLYLTII